MQAKKINMLRFRSKQTLYIFHKDMIQATLLQKGNQKMALRNVLVVENDNERLRKQSREITEITDKIKVLAEDMK